MIIKQNLLTINTYSRPGKPLKSVRKIVLHWVANPGTTALQNRNFFEMRKEGQEGYGSAHYIIDKDNIIQCIPDNEMAFHVGSDTYTDFGQSISSYPNARTLGIEFCHIDWKGKPEKETRIKLVDLLVEKCKKYGLDPLKDICRHFDITSKICPKYYVSNEHIFKELLEEVSSLV